MAEELYLESVLRDRLGITDALMKKTRAEALAELPSGLLKSVVITGRTHAAYGRPVVDEIIRRLSCKKTRGCEAIGITDGSLVELLSAALIQGVPCEIQGTEKVRSSEVTLTVQRISKNRMILMAENPDGAELPPVRLRVKNTTLFIHGMKVPGCRHVADDVYEFAGRQPRSRGRW